MTRNIVHMLSSQVVTWSLALVLILIQPRFLGAESLGRLRLAFSLWTIASVVIALGTSTYLQLEVARRGRDALSLIGPVLTLRTVMFLATSAGFAVGLLAWGADREFVAIMGLLGLVIWLTTMTDVYSSAFIGLERMAAPALVGIVTKLVGTIASVIVLLAGGRVIAVLIVAASSSAIGFALMLRAMRSITGIRLLPDVGHWRTIIRASVAFMLTGAILTLYQQIDTVVISVFVDETALGWYGTADMLFGTLLFLPTIVASTVFPTLGRLHQDDPGQLVVLVRRTFSSISLVAVPLGLGTMLIASDVAPLMFGEEFRETGPVLSVLGVVLIITTMTILIGAVAIATGRQRFWNTVMFVGVLMTVPLDMVLVPWTDRTYENGALGGALAYVVTESMMLIVGMRVITPFLIERSTVSRFARVVAAGGLMVAAAWPTRGTTLALTIVVGAFAFAIASLVLRVVGEDERRLARTLIGRVRGGSG